MADRMSSVFWAFCRGWVFGVVLGLVVGGGLGTLALPVMGTVYGGMIGAMIGAIAGLGAALLVAPAVLFRPSVITDRIWPGLVAAGVTFMLVTEVVFAETGRWSGADALFLTALVIGGAGLGAVFGATVTRGVRIRLLATPRVAVVGAVVGALVAAGRVIAEEGWSEPGLLAGFMLGGLVAGGILGAVLIAFNMLVTQESTEQ